MSGILLFLVGFLCGSTTMWIMCWQYLKQTHTNIKNAVSKMQEIRALLKEIENKSE